MIPVAIYARYSSDEQDPRSSEDQVRRCADHAQRHRCEVVAEFADAAISGAHTEREQFRRMLDVATATRRPPLRAVLVGDLSRLSRNMGDFWRVIDDLAAAGVHVIDVQTGMSSDDPNARMVFGAKSLVNDQFL
jgi:DNA invertase Pin-like site-specific DNA recombinase